MCGQPALKLLPDRRKNADTKLVGDITFPQRGGSLSSSAVMVEDHLDVATERCNSHQLLYLLAQSW